MFSNLITDLTDTNLAGLDPGDAAQRFLNTTMSTVFPSIFNPV
jgi:hypothetical protein